MSVGSHNYYYITHANVPFLLTISDCEYAESRRFINATPDTIFNDLSRAIIDTVWTPNLYEIQDLYGMAYILGQQETQSFIDTVSTACGFFGRLPMNLLCLASVGLYPNHDPRARIEVEIGIGSALEFHQNSNPFTHQRQL